MVAAGFIYQQLQMDSHRNLGLAHYNHDVKCHRMRKQTNNQTNKQNLLSRQSLKQCSEDWIIFMTDKIQKRNKYEDQFSSSSLNSWEKHLKLKKTSHIFLFK